MIRARCFELFATKNSEAVSAEKNVHRFHSLKNSQKKITEVLT
jgi:hypothetical protein